MRMSDAIIVAELRVLADKVRANVVALKEFAATRRPSSDPELTPQGRLIILYVEIDTAGQLTAFEESLKMINTRIAELS